VRIKTKQEEEEEEEEEEDGEDEEEEGGGVRLGLLRACSHGMMSFAQQTHFFAPCSGGILTCV